MFQTIQWLLSFVYSAPIPSPIEELTIPQKLQSSKNDHPALSSLNQLVEVGGGGHWPPQPSYKDSWPLPLRPYHDAYAAVAPSLPVLQASLDDNENRKTIDAFRSRLASELKTNINLSAVRSVLDGNESQFDTSAWMGFLTCIAMLRHAYRWGVSPIVNEAQCETSLVFPEELAAPWTILQHRFGFTSPSGNLTSNFYSNLNHATQRLEYPITQGMPEDHQNTEFWNTKLVVDMETRALPLYYQFAQAIAFVDDGNIDAAHEVLKSANEDLKAAFKYFFQNMVDATMKHELWMAYVQGVHGWTLEGFDGASGTQCLVFRTLDAFLGIRPFPTSELEALHFPQAQRDWVNTLRDYDIRAVAKERGAQNLTDELEAMVKQLRLWRMGHMRRMAAYEGVARPERQKQTAGLSVVDSSVAPDEQRMVEHLTKGLRVKLSQTV